MTFDEMVAAYGTKQSKHHNDEEHRIQCACVSWFNAQFPAYRGCLFAVPNGGRRDKVTAAKLKAEGVVAGVADMILLLPNKHHHALLIEMKTKVGQQSPTQKQWAAKVTPHGYQYTICRSLDEFMNTIKDYLHDMD